MKTVKIKSNSIRNRLFVVGNSLVLSFDENGIAECLESDVPMIVEYSRTRPNRLTIVEETKSSPVVPKAVPAPAPKVEVEKIEDPKPNINKAEPIRKFVKKTASKVSE